MRNRDTSWARLVSDVLSPQVIWGFLAFPIAFRAADSAEHAFLWAFTYTALVCILPTLYIAYGVWRGQITDIHIKVRQQRIRPFIVSIACTAFAWLLLRAMSAPPSVEMIALFSVLQIFIMLLITLAWQISIHAMSITGAVIVTAALYGPAAALLISPLILVVGAARIKLQRHTPAQVVAGGLLGSLTTALLFLIRQPL